MRNVREKVKRDNISKSEIVRELKLVLKIFLIFLEYFNLKL